MFYKRPSFALQKVAFQRAKGGLLHSVLPSFGKAIDIIWSPLRLPAACSFRPEASA